MKRFYSKIFFIHLIIFFQVLIPGIASAQSPEIKLTDQEKAWLKRHNTINVAGPRAFPPFHYVGEDNTIKGMASDYAGIISQRLGIKMIPETKALWPEILEKTKNREIDVLTCAAKSPERETYLSFTNPYLSFPMVIISKKQAPFISGIKDLHGKKIACIKKNTSNDWLKQDKIEFIPYNVNSPLEALEAVSVGLADVYLGNLAASSYLIEKKGLLNLKIAAPTSYGNYELYFAVRNDWPEMLSILNKALASIKPEEHSQIRQKWIAVRYEHGIDPAKVWKIVLYSFAAFAFILYIVYLWNRQIWRREERFRCLTEHGTDIIQAFKKDGTIIYQSPSHTAVLGYKADELKGTCVFDLFHKHEKDQWQKTYKLLLEGRDPHSIEHRICHKQGHYLYFESNFVNLLENKALKAIVMNARDITRRLQNQNEIKLAKEAAESANKAKSTFLANMSHELRTPLNAILGFARLIRKGKGLSENQVENTNIIIKSGNHLLNLINDVLDMSKIEAGRISLREDYFDLWLMLDDLEDMLRLRALEKGLQLIFDRSPDCPQYICTDEAKLRQILINLLNNALKFTKEGGVALRVGVLKENIESEYKYTGTDNLEPNNIEPGNLELGFEIEDTGIGVSEDKIGNIFEPFFQTRSGEHVEEGTGLGLPISRKFVQLMGGDIEIITKINQGSVFKFNIKISLSGAEKVNEKKKLPKILCLKQGQPQYKILVVDDRWDNRQLLIKLLMPLGFELQEAENGLQAVKIWEQWEPHLIWMDMRMPVMDGYEATKQIKASIKGQATAIIALTASSFEDERSVVFSAGCDDFLRKPFRHLDIFMLMNKHIGVEYEYEQEAKQESNKTLIKNDLSGLCFENLPLELLKKLEKAALEGDMSAMEEIIENIRSHDSKTADTLTALADMFDYAMIITCINKYNSQAEKNREGMK